MNTPTHQIHDMEQRLRELAAREHRSVTMDAAMTKRLEAALEARFQSLSERAYTRGRFLACAAALLLALGSLALLNLPESADRATGAVAAAASVEPETIAAADWDRYFPPAAEHEVATRNGVELHIETEEELPFTLDDCFL